MSTLSFCNSYYVYPPDSSSVAILIIGNGQTLASIINFKFCYIALNVFWAISGMIVGQVRSLRSFAWFTNVNIWLNIIVMIMTVSGNPSGAVRADYVVDGRCRQVSSRPLAVQPHGSLAANPDDRLDP